MSTFIVFLAALGLSVASPQFYHWGLGSSQYKIQDAAGNVAFGHVGGPNSREEVRAADGTTRGSYSYVDANGIVQSAIYAADAANGFRIAATDLPVGPAVPGGPVVHAARIFHPSIYHSLKKRDLVAVGSPLTSYPGSTAPLAHLAAHPYVAAPIHHLSPYFHVLKKRSALLPYALPAESPEVAHAKLAHLVQHDAETLRNHFGALPLNYPADTPEVSARKVADTIAQRHEAVRNIYGLPIAHVLKKRSVPAETPEVASARAAHLAQHAAETLRNHHAAFPLSYPADTPEVAARKVADTLLQNYEAARNLYHPYYLY